MSDVKSESEDSKLKSELPEGHESISSESDASHTSSDSHFGSSVDLSAILPTNMPPKVDKNAEISLSVLTKFIKPYNGDKESLPAFLTNCDNAISLANADQINVLCKYVISQLEGKAQVACSLKNFDSWDGIKNFLRATFGEKKHATHLLVDLQNCKQLPSEDVTQYSIRLESILTRMQSDIYYNCKQPNELVGRIAAMEDLALNTFLLGLNSSISNIVRCRNPPKLNDAIQCAVEEEKLYNLTKSSSSSFYRAKQCSLCHKKGHTSSECFRNKPQNQTQTQRSYAVNSRPAFDSLQGPKQCRYCKKQGHTIDECYKLKYKNSQTSQGQDPSQGTSAQAHVHNVYDEPSDDALNQE